MDVEVVLHADATRSTTDLLNMSAIYERKGAIARPIESYPVK